MEGVSVILPIALEDRERSLWESSDAAALLARLADELALLGREHPVLAVGQPETMPAWVRTLGVPVRPVPALAEPHSPLLPPGSLSALRALGATTGGAESRVAIMDFRSPLLSARTVRAAIASFCRDGHARISVGETPLNMVIAERPMESLAVGQVALVDEGAKTPDAPRPLLDRMGGPGPVSRPFLLSARALSRTRTEFAVNAWHAMVVEGSLFDIDPLLPQIVPASLLGLARFDNAHILSALLLEEEGRGRRLFPSEVLLQAGFLGMDPLWQPADATVVCLRRNGIKGLWVRDAFDQPSVRLRVWPVVDGQGVLPEASRRELSPAAERVEIFGQQFVGPVLAVDENASSLVWRLERPAGVGGGDFVEQVRPRRELWDVDQATGVKRNCANGACIFGRQNYPENLIATQGLWVGRVGDAMGATQYVGKTRARGIRVYKGEAVSVRDMHSLLRAVCCVRQTARPFLMDSAAGDRLVLAENF